MIGGVSTVLVGIGWLAMAGAESAPAASAETLMAQGLELRRAGRDEEALKAFQQAQSVAASPKALAQIGMAEQALGRWTDAERDLVGALEARTDGWIVRSRATLEQALATVRLHVGELNILGSPAGARVLIDARPAGTLPLASAVHVAAGEVVVTVEADGHESITRKVVVAGGTLVRETIDLPPAAPRGLKAEAGSGGAPLLLGADVTAKPADSDERPVYQRPWFWIVVGAAAVAAGTTAFLLAGQSDSYPTPDMGTFKVN